jgi:hypothetical protein
MADAHDLENVWAIAYVGNGLSKKDEYLIVNRGTGLHMTSGGNCTRTDFKAYWSLELTQWQSPPFTGSS